MMIRLFPRFAGLSSARVRLTLWNTLTFALVLFTLGIAFHFLAERSLMTALDREMKFQGNRFRDTQRVEMFVLTDNLRNTDVSVRILHTPGEHIRSIPGHVEAHYQILRNISVPPPDRSGQFLYRAFDLKGKPVAPFDPAIPFHIPRLHAPQLDANNNHLKDYRPWDRAAFLDAAQGKERFSDIISEGAHLRILSLPLHQSEKVRGVVQIAAPLAQVNRDIAGLTHTLLLIMPPALLIAAIAGVFLTGRALSPVNTMAQAAAGIRPDQLSQRLPPTGTAEFDELVSTFNGALDRMETAFVERERAMEQLRRFTADASHELRTPLTTIKANTGVALVDSDPSAEHVHALRQIDRAADRMTALVQDLLLLARSDAGQLPLDFSVVSLEEIVREAIDSLPSLPRAPIVLDVRTAGLEISGDFEHLVRLFLNLLQNAARHTPNEGRIEVRFEQQDQHAVVSVRDNGCGIPPEHLPHLGQRFYRADAGRNRRQGGAGLGLAICRSIAAAHHAVMTIDSDRGKGTTITVTFDALA